jgi:hypothetical protein
MQRLVAVRGVPGLPQTTENCWLFQPLARMSLFDKLLTRLISEPRALCSLTARTRLSGWQPRAAELHREGRILRRL